MKSILIVMKEKILAKGIALALMEEYQSIHILSNPYEAISKVSEQKIDVIISAAEFPTINQNEYLAKMKSVIDNAQLLILFGNTDLHEQNDKIILLEKPVSIDQIKSVIKLHKHIS